MNLLRGTVKAKIATVAAPTLVAMAVPMLMSSPAAAAVDCNHPPAAIVHPINHDAVTVQHPAVTHPEWLWSKVVVDQPYVAGTPAIAERSHTETASIDGEGTPEGAGWSRTGEQSTIVDRAYVPGVPGVPAVPDVPEIPERSHLVQHDAVTHTDFEWRSDTKVVDQEAVYVTEYEFAHNTNGADKTRWETNPDWNAESNPQSKGWAATGATRQTLEKAEKSHVESTYEWSAKSPGDGWTKTGKSEVIVDKDAWVEKVIDQVYVPGVAGTPAIPAVEEIPEITHVRYEWTRTVIDQPYVAAVEEVMEQSHTETTTATSTQAPADGSFKVDGSEVLVEDEAAYIETLKDAWIEYVVIPGEAPTGECDIPVTEPAPEVLPDGQVLPAEQAKPTSQVQPAGQVLPAAQSAPSGSAQVLPNTGAPGWLGAAGLAGASMLIAGVLVLRRAKI